MRRGKKALLEGVKVTFAAIVGRQGGEGIFGIEDAAEEIARRTKLALMAEQITAYDRGYEGRRRRCPRCGQWQKYKGEAARELVFDCGTLTVQRAPGLWALVGSERHAMTLRRVAVREAEHLAASGHHQTFPLREHDRLYLEVEGHMCPTCEPKQGPED